MTNGNPDGEGSLHQLDLQLPPLPQTLPLVLERLHAPGVPSVEGIAEVIRGDPAVLSRVLKHINSAYYGLRRSIADIERAVLMMGPKTAAGTVVSLCMLELDELMEGPAGRCFRNLLRHSEASAFLTRYLLNEETASDERATSEAAGSSARDGFTEGLLHDFGKLVLIYNHPDKAISLYENEVFQGELAEPDQRMLEQHVFGCDHTEAGGYAASKMNFPQALIDVIQYHHDLGAARGRTDAMKTLKAVGVANHSTKAMGPEFAGVHPIDKALDWETCADHPAWDDFLNGKGGGAKKQPLDLTNDLNEKREDVVLFSQFFLDQETAGCM